MVLFTKYNVTIVQSFYVGRNYYDRKAKVLFVVCSYYLHLYDYTDGDISTVHLAGTRHIGTFHARECMHDHSEFIYS